MRAWHHDESADSSDELPIRFGTLHDRPGEEPKRDGMLVVDGGRVVVADWLFDVEDARD